MGIGRHGKNDMNWLRSKTTVIKLIRHWCLVLVYYVQQLKPTLCLSISQFIEIHLPVNTQHMLDQNTSI
jgi:hypothetical protein